MRYCQGTRCHTYDTKDRKKGSKGNKRNENQIYFALKDDAIKSRKEEQS